MIDFMESGGYRQAQIVSKPTGSCLYPPDVFHYPPGAEEGCRGSRFQALRPFSPAVSRRRYRVRDIETDRKTERETERMPVSARLIAFKRLLQIEGPTFVGLVPVSTSAAFEIVDLKATS